MTTGLRKSLEQQIHSLAERARKASFKTAKLSTEKKNNLLLKIACKLNSERTKDELLGANQRDLEEARKNSLSEAMLDRLALDNKRLSGMIQSLEEVASLPDPVGVTRRMWTRPNGLRVGKFTIPLGVIGIIYEARPNVTIDAFALCFKAGNSTVLKGGSEALNSNRVLAKTIREVLESSGIEDACQLVDSTNREAVSHLLEQDQTVDLIIPRGGEELIRFVVQNSRIPVIKHYKGVCHIYVDEYADLSMAISIAENAKVSRPAVCNALETLLVHENAASSFFPVFSERMRHAGVQLKGDALTRDILPKIEESNEEDYYTEYLEARAARHAAAQVEDHKRQQFLKRELDWIRRGPKARTTKQKSRIDRFEEASEQAEYVAELDVDLVIPPAPQLGNRIVELDNVGIELGGQQLVRELSLQFEKGMRLGIVGRNGVGKTTLLKVLLGQLPPSRGEVAIGDLTRFNYVDQARVQLDEKQTAMEAVGEGGDHVRLGDTSITLRGYLKRFLFTDERLNTRVAQLSGGERSRLLIAKILKDGGNFLILDEPTNDLDLPTLRVLEEALADFDGCVVAVSHDRYFLNRICTGLLAFEDDGAAVG